MQTSAFSLQLKMLRLRHSWTQAFVAEQIGTTTVNVSRWERGVLVPGLYFRRKICDLFDIHIDKLNILPQYDSKGEKQTAEQEYQETFEVTLPFCSLPEPRNVLFTGRDEALEDLHTYFSSEVYSEHTCIQALCGMGGIGKTQTALEFAYRYRHNYTALFWIHVESWAAIEADVTALAGPLNLAEHAGQSFRDLWKAFLNWLETHSNWLLILDNLTDFHILEKLVISNPSGHILLTTRSQVTGTLARSIDLQNMTYEEGALFLLRRAKLLSPQTPLSEHDPNLMRDAYAITRLMDSLPLALDQIGSYLEETNRGLADYLVIHEEQSVMLLQRRGQFATGHPASLAETILQTYRWVELASPLAANFLYLLVHLDESTISEENALTVVTQLDKHRSLQISGPADAKIALYEIIAILRQCSLISLQTPTRKLFLHPLVQEVLKNALGEQVQSGWIQQSYATLSISANS